MVEIKFADSAWEDLDSITDYIALDSVRYAEEFSNRILDHIEKLGIYPNLGRMVPEFQNEDLRELIQGKYRIVYRIYSDQLVIVLRIIHGSKLLF